MSTELNNPALGTCGHYAPPTEDDEPVEALTVRRYCEYAAAIPPGQFVVRKLHSALWCVENTLKFLLRSEESSPTPAPATGANNGDGDQQQQQQPHSPPEKRAAIRPLPWMLMLPALVALQACIEATRLVARLTSCQSLVIGSRTITRLQAYRRELRAVRLGGQRIMRLQGKRSRLGPISRLARFLCERLFRIRAERQTVASSTLSRKASKIDVNVDLHSALNRTYTDADDLNDATFYPDDEEPYQTVRTKRRTSKTNTKSPKRRQTQQPQQQPAEESRAADASDEHESSASSDESDATDHRPNQASATESSITEEQHLVNIIEQIEQRQ